MKKLIILLVIVTFTFSCVLVKSNKEVKELKNTISQYFNAMKDLDKKTMYSLSLEPKTIPYKSYKIVNIDKPIIEEYQPPILSEKIHQLEQKRYELVIAYLDLEDELSDLEYMLKETRNIEKKTEFKKKIEELKKISKEKAPEIKNLSLKIYELQKKIETEERFLKLSAGITKEDLYTGETHTVKVKIKATLNDGEKKEFEFLLKKYVLNYILNQETKPAAQGNWIIANIPDDKKFINLENIDYVDYLFENLKEIYGPLGVPPKNNRIKPIVRNAIIFTVETDGKISINKEPVDSNYLTTTLKEIYQNRVYKTIYFRILKEKTSYEEIADLVYIMRKSGIERILPIITDEIKPVVLKRFNNQIDLPEISVPIEIPDGIEEEDISDYVSAIGIEGGVEGGVVGGVLGGVVGGILGGVVGEVEAPIRAVGEIKPPRCIKEVKPIYPEIARQARVEGLVILEATTDIYGRVQTVKVLKSIALLDQAAVDAVRQWLYEPMVINGRPFGVIFTVTVRFALY
jgi:TonB family protein